MSLVYRTLYFRHTHNILIYVAAEQDIKLYVSPNTLNKSGEWVTVSWSSVSQPSTLDWVGLWVLPDNQTSIDAKTKAPVKYQVCAVILLAVPWLMSVLFFFLQYCNHSSTHLSKGFGKLRIYLVNMRGVNQFGFFRGGTCYVRVRKLPKTYNYLCPMTLPLHKYSLIGC